MTRLISDLFSRQWRMGNSYVSTVYSTILIYPQQFDQLVSSILSANNRIDRHGSA